MAGPLYKGVPIPIFTVGVNWDQAPSLRVINHCVISEALDTSEDRQDKLPRPLYGIKFEAMPLSAKEQGYIRKFRELAKAMPVGMPVWMMKCKLTSNANIGATVIQFDDDTNTLLPVLSEYALIWSRFDNWEVVKLASKTSTSLTTVAGGVTKNWVATDGDQPYVIPLLFGSLVRSPENQVTDEIDTLNIDFEERAPVTLATTELIGTLDPNPFVDDSVHYYSAHFSRVGVAGNGFSIQTVWGGNISTDYTITPEVDVTILGFFMIYDRHGGYMMSNWLGGNNEQFAIGYLEPLAPGPGPDGDCFYAFCRDNLLNDWIAYATYEVTPDLNKWYALALVVPAGTHLVPAGGSPTLYVSDGTTMHGYPMFSETSGAFYGLKPGGANVLIGSRSAPSYSFDGRIDQLGVWLNRALTSLQIGSLVAAQGARYPSLTAAQKVNLRAYWEFDTEDHLATALLVTPQYQYLDRLGYSSHVPVGLPPWHATPFDSDVGGVTVVPFPDRAAPVPIV